jgi:hypothetical protein
MQPKDKKRLEKLSAISSLDAVRAWLDGNFGMGDEPALISAIRKNLRIKISDEAIEDVIMDAMGEELDAETCLERLVG